MTGSTNIRDEDLHAFLDGALDAAQARVVAAAIEADPALAARLAGFRADKAMLKKAYGAVADRPVPDHWLALARSVRPQPQRTWRMVGSIAALVLVALVGVTAYRALQTNPPAGDIVQTALAVRQNGSGQTIVVADAGTASQYNATISAILSEQVKTPNLGRMGYHLTAIQIDSKAPGGGAVELQYRNRRNRLFTLYLHRSDGNARFDQFEKSGLRICIWQDDRVSMVMAGDVSTAAMQRLASLAYTGLIL
jgi:anti-sigma factor RsiW